MKRSLLSLIVTLPFLAQDVVDARQEAWSGRWDPQIVELFESLPVQDGGRVKPMHTYAGFTLLRMQGKRSLTTSEGERLTPVEWMLDTLFRPELASHYPTFLVQNDEVIGAMGLSLSGKKKRDRYSFEELRPGIPKLFGLAREIGAVEEKDRGQVQQQIYLLAANVNSYGMLLEHMDFARAKIHVAHQEDLERIFEGATDARFEEIIRRMEPLSDVYGEMVADANADMEQFRAVGSVLQHASDLAETTEFLALVPPVEGADGALEATDPWVTPAGLFRQAFEHGSIPAEQLAVLTAFGTLARTSGDDPAFLGSLEGLHEGVLAMTERSGAYDKIPLELSYYKLKLLDYGQYLFVLSFLLMAFMWLRPRSRVLYAGTGFTVLAATLLVSAAIVLRCVIRGRPPVSTLYETVLFVTAVGALVALFMELVNRQKIALSSAAILGMIGLFIANGYELLDKRDTMPSLVAVLDTNFWLATHVTSITIGYGAGMLAALLASVYLLAKLVSALGKGVRGPSRAFYKNLGRMVYGVLCFAMIFSLVGTILGGIWANDSWGRFWGWDPKENGALLIVISQLVILHGRMGGYLREHGLCIAAALGGTVIAFSWWGVNLLGVGLHSYGFTSGIHTALWTYYGIQWSIAGLGGLAWLLESVRREARANASSQAPSKRRVPGTPGSVVTANVEHTPG